MLRLPFIIPCLIPPREQREKICTILLKSFLGEWEALYNPNFNYTEFGTIRNMAGCNNFVLSVKTWIERTNAIGMLYNPIFNPFEFEGIRAEAGLNAFTMSPTR